MARWSYDSPDILVIEAMLLANLDAAVSSRAVPGDAMALTPAERLIVQALILADATQFNGANIDAAITSRAVPGDSMDLLAATIVAIRKSVCAVGDPADSIGKALYELYENRLTALRAGYIDTLNTGVLVGSRTDAFNRLAGMSQTFSKQITAAANAGDVIVATITSQLCLIKSIVLCSNGATTADLTSAAIYGGAGKVVTFIDATTGARVNINAIDKQVSWVGAASLPAIKTIVITLTGTGGTAVDLQVNIEYCSIVNGGYLV